MNNSIKEVVSVFILIVCLSLSTGLHAKGLNGVWKYKTNDKTSTVSYKVFTKAGRYMNIRSNNNGKTYFMKQEGLFEIVTPGLYIEHLGATPNHGSTGGDYMISYKIKKNKLLVSFQLGNNVYNEEWEKVDNIEINLNTSAQ